MIKKILLIEDSPERQFVIQTYLPKTPHHLDIANDGDEGVYKVVKGDYDVILMDMQMPVMDGLEATRQLRDKAVFDKVPIIALTASADTDSVRMGIEAGCDEHLPKPVQTKELFELLDRYLTTP